MKQISQIFLLALTVGLSSVDAIAYATPIHPQFPQTILEPQNVSYTENVVETPGWKGNWFIGVNGGVNAFIGSPLGCEDIWGRMKPHFGVNVGKWYTPTIGSRLSFSGFSIKNGDIKNQNYWSASADMLWNISNVVNGKGDTPKFSLVPYVGFGVIHNNQAKTSLFAISYGIMAQYGLTSRLSVTLEAGAKTTFSDFDGIGASNRFGGDNLLSLSAGLTYTIGRTGFRKVIDAKPFLIDNAKLRETCRELYEANNRLSNQNARDARALAELKKILEIEGLLARYGNLFDSEYDKSGLKKFPINDYSGLNSLRARLRGAGLDAYSGNGTSADNVSDDELTDFIESTILGDSKENNDSASDKALKSITETGDSIASSNLDSAIDSKYDKYFALIRNGESCVGSPILFFFQLGTTNLTDQSQLVNLDEIARVAKTYGLRIRVTGAADSQTGTTDINNRLGNDRADYIISQLKDRGISASLITKNNRGGIDLFNPGEANRHCKIELFLTAK